MWKKDNTSYNINLPLGGNRSQVFYFVINTQRVALLLYFKELNVLTRVSAEDHFHSFILFSLTSNNPMLAAIDSFFFPIFKKGMKLKKRKEEKTNFFNGMCRQQEQQGPNTQRMPKDLPHFKIKVSAHLCVCVACRRSFVRSGENVRSYTHTHLLLL